jgi:hypothetical protein
MHAIFLFLALASPPGVEVELKRPADKVVIASGEMRTSIVVTSATGIGGAKLRPGEGGWPKSVRLDLNLKALEGFTITSGDLRVHTFLGSDKPEVLRRKGEKWEPAKADGDLAPVIKRDGDRILIDLPPAWLDAKPKELEIQWVDYYRG